METRSQSKRWSCRPAQWQSLPPELLFRVFNHLPDYDRCNARSACRGWDEVFRMPQLWRERQFAFRGEDENEGWRAARYMATLGPYLRRLDLDIGMPVVENARAISLAVEKFLNTKPRGLRLHTFTCSGLEFFQTPLYRITRHRARMVRAVCSLLKRQKGLEVVNMSYNQMGREDGTRVLKALTSHRRPHPSKDSASGLSVLELREFFMDDISPVELPAFLEEMGRFPSLTHVGLNFTYLNDAVLGRLTQSTSRLERMALSVDGSHLVLISHMARNNLAVSTAGWRAAAQRCPQLRVQVDFRGRYRLEEFQSVLRPGMPLASVSLTSPVPSLFFGSEDMLDHIGSLMVYIGKSFPLTLTAFHLGWLDNAAMWTHPEALVRLVTKCTSLRCLSLAMLVPLDTVLKVAAASKKTPAEPLHLYVSGFDSNIRPSAAQLKVSGDSPRFVVHTD